MLGLSSVYGEQRSGLVTKVSLARGEGVSRPMPDVKISVRYVDENKATSTAWCMLLLDSKRGFLPAPALHDPAHSACTWQA